MVEFALVMAMAIPLFLGTVSVGITIGRGVQAAQIARDLGHMYALGVDVSQSGNQNIATDLAQGFDLSASGNAATILSQVIKVYPSDCAAAGLGNNCTNVNQTVFINRIVIGNSSLRSSNFGTPPSGYVNSRGNIAHSD